MTRMSLSVSHQVLGNSSRGNAYGACSQLRLASLKKLQRVNACPVLQCASLPRHLQDESTASHITVMYRAAFAAWNS